MQPSQFELPSQDELPQTPEKELCEPVRPRRRIGRLSNRAFWIIIYLAVVIIIAAALGGGIGEGLARHNSAASAAQSQSQPSSSNSGVSTITSVATTTTSTPPLSITEEIGPSVTLFRDCPSSDNTLRSLSLGNTTYEFRKLCTIQITNSDPYMNVINQGTVNLDDCINLCAAWNAYNATSGTGIPQCETVCWRNGFGSNDDHPGVCFGFQTTNTTQGTFDIAQGYTDCDSAVWINQP